MSEEISADSGEKNNRDESNQKAPAAGAIGSVAKNLPTAAKDDVLSPTTEGLPSFQEHDMYEQCDDMFHKLGDYLKGELELVSDDYTLLEQMNNATATKYSDMKQVAANISKALSDLNLKYKSLTPVLQQIDEVEVNVAQLEQASYRLDAYAKHLETKLKHLEKR